MARDDKESSKPSDALCEAIYETTLGALGPLLVEQAGTSSHSMFSEANAEPQQSKSKANGEFHRVAGEVPEGRGGGKTRTW